MWPPLNVSGWLSSDRDATPGWRTVSAIWGRLLSVGDYRWKYTCRMRQYWFICMCAKGRVIIHFRECLFWLSVRCTVSISRRDCNSFTDCYLSSWGQPAEGGEWRCQSGTSLLAISFMFRLTAAAFCFQWRYGCMPGLAHVLCLLLTLYLDSSHLPYLWVHTWHKTFRCDCVWVMSDGWK